MSFRSRLQLILMTSTALLASSALADSPAGRIDVKLTGFENDSGWAMIALYDDANSFPSKPEKALRNLRRKIKAGTVVVSLKAIPRGEYAISAFHDENANGKLDTNFIGIPKEALGCSNNAKGVMGPPKWKDARFKVADKAVSQKITIKHL